jgi:hypothetical protein
MKKIVEESSDVNQVATEDHKVKRRVDVHVGGE